MLKMQNPTFRVVCEVQHDEGTLQVSRTGIGLLRVSARDTVAGGQLVF